MSGGIILNGQVYVNINADDFLSKSNVTDAINENSTEEQIPSAKSVYDNAIKNNNIKTYTNLSQLGLTAPVSISNIYNAIPFGSIAIIRCSTSEGTDYKVTDLPEENTQGILIIDKVDKATFNIVFKRSTQGSISENSMYIGQLKGEDGTGLTWKGVCTTSVADINKTKITLTSSDNYKVTYADTNLYQVKNGVCYVRFDITVVSPISTSASTSDRIFGALPKAKMDAFRNTICYNSSTLSNMYVQVDNSGNLNLWGGTTGHRYIGSFSYPV